jgi:hypothetical protein
MSLEKWSIEEGWILCKMDGLQCVITCPQFKRGTTAFPITTIGLITHLQRKQSPPGREWVGACWASRGRPRLADPPGASGGPRLPSANSLISCTEGARPLLLGGWRSVGGRRTLAELRTRGVLADLTRVSDSRFHSHFAPGSTPDSRSHSISRCPCLY